MNKIYSYLLEPGKTYDCQVCVGCETDFQENLKANLKRNAIKSKYPTIISTFNEQDEKIIYNFLKRNKISGGLFFTVYNLYVDTKLAHSLLKVMDHANNKKYPSILDVENLFINGTFEDFKNLYLTTYSPEGILSSIGGKNHSFEVNIFEEKITDIFLQRSINNLIKPHTQFGVKIFTDSDDLISHQNSFDKIIEAPRDYILLKLNNKKTDLLQ